MIYAPIVIPTCNRLTHLKRCIASLQANSWAKHTELYLSVDYPPSEKYENGYPELCEWLSEKPKGFKAVHIFIQPQNLGPIKNVQFLTDLVSNVYDRFMITEDDNEFSPNFIEYMDKCLEQYETDPSVLFVCAASELRNIDDLCAGGGEFLPSTILSAIRFRNLEEKIRDLFKAKRRYHTKSYPLFFQVGL